MPKKMTLAQAQQRLDEILAVMNDGTLPFDELLKYYEEATSLLAFSYKEINRSKGKFEELKEKLERECSDGEESDG